MRRGFVRLAGDDVHVWREMQVDVCMMHDMEVERSSTACNEFLTGSAANSLSADHISGMACFI